jgi:transposase
MAVRRDMVKDELRSTVRLRKAERHQLSLLPHCIDDWVSAEHRVRTVMAVVEKLDLSGFCLPIRARKGRAGRDATDPHLLVGLWLYGCVRGIGSARELARRCEESLPFRWLCGGVSVNHRLLSDFRSDHGLALDGLFTQLIVLLVDRKLVRVSRISQDGVRIRVSAGSKSFRREERLEILLEKARQHVSELRERLESPGQSSAMTVRQRGARKRAGKSRQQRLEEALAQLPELKQKQAESGQRAGQGKSGDKIRARELRVSTTDAAVRVMKMANGGYRPAANVQLATDTESRAILGVSISHEGSDSAGLSQPMREQVEQRTGGKVKQHLLDGGYLRMEDIEQAHQQGVELFVPAKPARNPNNRGKELQAKPGDSESILAWKQRMEGEEGKKIYLQRAATSETVNADLRTYRGLTPLTVRGMGKIECVVLWCALAYNLIHFGTHLLG